jgi:hypothetical protein
MTNEVVVHDHRIEALLDHAPMTFAAAASRALTARATRTDGETADRAPA